MTTKFSDECSVERGAETGSQWVFCLPHERYNKEAVKPYTKGKDISIMVWACIWYTGRSELIIMERDEDAPQRGYTANSYYKALDEGLVPCYGPSEPFVQDNVSIHTARSSQHWLEKHGVWVLNWPPFSPDLNPIEHAWFALKRLLEEHYPELNTMGQTAKERELFKQATKHCWQIIPQTLFQQVISSMGRRLQAVRQAQSWYKK